MPDPAETVQPDVAPDQTTSAEIQPQAVEAGGPVPAESTAVQDTLQAEVASLKDRVLRTMADMENLRRRTEREVADAKSYGVSSFARDMLTVADNLQRAQANLPESARGDLRPEMKSFIEGVELTERDFLSRLARFGIRPIETTGQRFDPNRHEALYELPDPSVPSGTVVQEVETGYTIADRVLRPAKVGVARGGAKPESA